MSQDKQFMLGDGSAEVGPVYVEHLAENGVLDERKFSFYMQTTAEGISHVDLGAPLSDMVKGGDLGNVIELPMENDFFWSSWLQGIAFGNTRAENAYTFEEGMPYTITDTGSSHLFVPADYYEVMIVKIMEAAGNPEYVIEQGITLCECATTFKPLYMMMNNRWIEMRPEEYLFDVSENQDQSVCHVMVLANSYSFFLVGLPFFQGYYTIHDLEAPSIGYIPHDNSSKDFLVYGEIPDQYLTPIVHNVFLEQGPYVFLALMAALYYFVLMPQVEKSYEKQTWQWYTAIGVYALVVLAMLWFLVMPLLEKFFGTPEEAIPEDVDDASKATEASGATTDESIEETASGSDIAETPAEALVKYVGGAIALAFLYKTVVARRLAGSKQDEEKARRDELVDKLAEALKSGETSTSEAVSILNQMH